MSSGGWVMTACPRFLPALPSPARMRRPSARPPAGRIDGAGCQSRPRCGSSPRASARDQPSSLRSSLEPGETTVKDAACGQPRLIRRFDQHRRTSTWSQEAQPHPEAHERLQRRARQRDGPGHDRDRSQRRQQTHREIRDRLAAEQQVRYDGSTAQHRQRRRRDLAANTTNGTLAITITATATTVRRTSACDCHGRARSVDEATVPPSWQPRPFGDCSH